MSNAKDVMNRYYIHYLITVVLVFAGHFVPNIEPITEQGMVLLFAFFGAAYGWSFIDMLWPSILAILSMGIELGMGTVLASGVGSSMVWMCIVLYVVIGYMAESKLIDNVASYFLTRKFVRGRPWVLFSLIIFANFICANLNGFAALMMFLTVAYKTCELLKVPPYTKLPTMLGLGIVLGIGLASIMFPFRSGGLILLSAWVGISGSAVNFGKYMMVSFPAGCIALLLFILITKYIVRADVTAFREFTPESVGVKCEKFTSEQKIAGFMMAWVIFDLFVASVLPATWPVIGLLNEIGLFGQGIIPILVFMVVRHKGKAVLNFQKLAGSYVAWDIIMVMGVILPLSNFLAAPTTGIQPFVAELIQPLLGIGVIGFLLLALGITTILSNFANNTVIALIMMPVLNIFMQYYGFNGAVLIFLLMFAQIYTFLTPGASPFLTIMLGYSDWVQPVGLIRYGVITLVLIFFTSLPIVYLLSSLIF